MALSRSAPLQQRADVSADEANALAVGRSGRVIVTEDSTARTSQGGQGRFAETSVFWLVRKPRRRLSQNSVCLLAPGGKSGERIEERGIPNKNMPPLPSPLLREAEEREKIRSLDTF